MALAKLGRLELLSQLYGLVYLPPAVYQEVVVRGRRQGYPDAWLVQRAIQRQQLSVVGVEPLEKPILRWTELPSRRAAIRHHDREYFPV